MKPGRIAWSIVGILLLFGNIQAAFAAVPTYTIVELEPFPGDTFTEAFGINESGDVVGFSYHRTTPFPDVTVDGSAFLYRDGLMIDLGKLDGVITRAEAINESGAIVGWTDASFPRAWVRLDGGLTDIGTLAFCCAQAFDINDLGQVVGWSYGPNGTEHGFLWDNGVFQDLGSIGCCSPRLAINNHKQVVGPGFLWDDGVRTSIAMRATDINDLGQIIGFAYGGPAILDGGVFYLIGGSTARGINNLGDIVGDGFYSGEGALFWHARVKYDLNNLIPPGAGWNLFFAWDISDAGRIVGTGSHGDGEFRGFLLIPINPDLDEDRDVDLLDFFSIQGCLSGPQGIIVPGCQDSDLDGDGDVDLVDVRSLQLGFTGAL